MQGNLLALPTLTDDEYTTLLVAATAFDECPEPVAPERPRIVRPEGSDELPGTRFNRENGQREVLHLFQRHGYAVGRVDPQGNVPITRPGASSDVSGNVSRAGVLHMFSTNTDFIPSVAGKGNPYTPFAVLTWLEYGGDYSASGKALYREYNPPAIRIVRDREVSNSPDITPADEEQGTDPGEGAPIFRLYTDDELLALPVPDFLIDDLIPEGGLLSVVGASGCYKTFAALDMSLCIATGTPYFGRAVKQAPVIYVSAEGQGGFGLRVAAWKQARGVTETIPLFRAMLDAPQMMDVTHVAMLIHTVRTMGITQGLLTLDTRARTFAGDENSAEDTGHYIDACAAVQRGTGWAVNAVHHHGKAGTTRGSSAWYAALDAEITFSKDETGEVVSAEVTKAKDWEDGQKFAFTPVVVELGEDANGKMRTSVTLSPVDVPVKPVRVDERKRVYVTTLYGEMNTGLRFAEWMAALKSPKTTFYRTITELEKNGEVEKRGDVYFVTGKGITLYSSYLFREDRKEFQEFQNGSMVPAELEQLRGSKVPPPLGVEPLEPSSGTKLGRNEEMPEEEDDNEPLF